MRRVNMAKRVFAMGLATALTVTSVISPQNVVAVQAADDSEEPVERTEMQLPITLYDINKDNMFFEYDNNLFYLFSFVAGNIFQPYAEEMGLHYTDNHYYYNYATPDEGYIWGDWLNINNVNAAANFGNAVQAGDNTSFWIRKGLVENTLGADKIPRYTQSAVEYMAKAVQLVLNKEYEQYGIQGDNLSYSGGQNKKDSIFRETSDYPETSIYTNPTIQYLMKKVQHTSASADEVNQATELIVDGSFANVTGNSTNGGTFGSDNWRWNAFGDTNTNAHIWTTAYNGANAVVVGYNDGAEAPTKEPQGYLYQKFTAPEDITYLQLSMDTKSWSRMGRMIRIVDEANLEWAEKVRYEGHNVVNLSRHSPPVLYHKFTRI